MALTKEAKQEIIKTYGKNEKDTGSIAVQIAILTAEINELNEHFAVHIHDYHSKRGLMTKIGHRRRLLKYLKDNNLAEYEALIAKLGLRR